MNTLLPALVVLAGASLFLNLEWVFFTLLSVIIILLVLEYSPTTEKRAAPHAHERKNQPIVVIQQRSAAKEMMNEITRNIINDNIFPKNKN